MSCLLRLSPSVSVLRRALYLSDRRFWEMLYLSNFVDGHAIGARLNEILMDCCVLYWCLIKRKKDRSRELALACGRKRSTVCPAIAQDRGVRHRSTPIQLVTNRFLMGKASRRYSLAVSRLEG